MKKLSFVFILFLFLSNIVFADAENLRKSVQGVFPLDQSYEIAYPITETGEVDFDRAHVVVANPHVVKPQCKVSFLYCVGVDFGADLSAPSGYEFYGFMNIPIQLGISIVKSFDIFVEANPMFNYIEYNVVNPNTYKITKVVKFGYYKTLLGLGLGYTVSVGSLTAFNFSCAVGTTAETFADMYVTPKILFSTKISNDAFRFGAYIAFRYHFLGKREIPELITGINFNGIL